MRRIVVAGGNGFFGRAVTLRLRADGLAPVVTTRAVLDVDDPASIRATLRAGDVVVDAAGPFASRSTALLEAACDLGVDVVDLNETIAYGERVASLAPRIERAGIAVLTSCSAVSAVVATLVARSEVRDPVRVSALLVPAARHTASAGTVHGLLDSVGRPIQVWRDGRLASAVGWRESRRFALPRRRGRLVGSVISLDLPRAWPSLRTAEMWVDANVPGANALLALVARSTALRALARRTVAVSAVTAHLAGRASGLFAVEVESSDGRVARLALTAALRSYLIAAAPAALAARALAQGAFTTRGLVRADQQVDASRLLAYLDDFGVALETDGAIG